MKKKKPIRVITLASGYDSQCLALKYAGIPFDLVYWCEYDPTTPNTPIEQQPAVVAHNIFFTEYSDRNLGDLTKVDWEKIAAEVGEIDLLTTSTPCTDISLAGKQAGFEKGSGTRSSILWNVEDAIKYLKPKWIMFENVRNTVSPKYIPLFLEWVRIVNSYGYNTVWKVLNAVDYNCPQNRERVFAISSRLDVSNLAFTFPEPVEPTIKLLDLIDDEVPENYYLSDEKVKAYLDRTKMHKNKGDGFQFKPLDVHNANGGGEDTVCGCIRANGLFSYSEPHVLD